MPIERLRMRPWLENIINTNKYPGVEWLDREQKIFRIPWKHASRNGWKINTDASLFRAWAEHTGKYKAKEKPNPKTWKANFRCALNSLPDMMEVREKRSTKGSNAFKVYQMTDKPTCAEMKRPPRKYRGRYQRKKHCLSKSNDDQKESRPKSNPGNENETAGSEILEPVEVNTAMPFSVPQPLYRKHLVDHDYAVTRYFDLLDETAGEDMEEVFEVPETKIVKTEHFSSCLGRDLGDYSFYEDDNTNSKNLDRISSEEAADKVMSDDEVIELIDELSSECDSASADSGDTTMDDLLENCIDSMADDVETPAKQRANSAPAVLESSLDKFAVLTTSIITKSNSLPDIQTIMSTSPQDLLQSCLS